MHTSIVKKTYNNAFLSKQRKAENLMIKAIDEYNYNKVLSLLCEKQQEYYDYLTQILSYPTTYAYKFADSGTRPTINVSVLTDFYGPSAEEIDQNLDDLVENIVKIKREVDLAKSRLVYRQ